MTQQENITEVARTDRLQNYHRVVDAADLLSVQMIKSHFEVKPDFFSIEEEKRKLRYDVDVTGVEFSPEKGVAMAFIRLSVDSKPIKKKRLLFCEAEYIVVYEGLTDCDANAVDVFVRRVATFACYPYFRSHFANLDWAATTRLPPLPVLKEPARVTENSN